MKHFEKEVLGKTEWQVNKDPGKMRILISFSSCTDFDPYTARDTIKKNLRISSVNSV